MGWTGGTDTLSQVELHFPSAEAAIAYARRQGLNFVVQGVAETPEGQCPMADNWKPGDPDRLDLDRALTEPAAAFNEPPRVVRHPQLSPKQKHEILRRWALEGYRTDDADKWATACTEPFRSSRRRLF